MTTYNAITLPYTYEYQPASDASQRLYLENQLRSLSRSSRTHSDAIVQLQTGITAGKISLSQTGVTPGRFKNATVRVGADGRITAISEGKAPQTLPSTAIAGQILTSTGDGSNAIWSPAPPVAPVPAGGSVGQVLTRTSTTAYAWADPASSSASSQGMTLRSDSDLAISTSNGDTVVDLTPTGVTAGVYSLASIAVDAKGRITHAYTGSVEDPAPFGFSTAASTTAHTMWRLYSPGGLTAPPLAVQSISFSTAIGGSDLGGTASSDPSSISRTFSGPQPVNAISVTAGDPSTAPMYGSVQYSDDGGLWTTAWELPPQATWSAGETRVFSIQPTPATGTVDPDRPLSYLTFFDGDDEVRVSIANAAWIFATVTGIEAEDGSGTIATENDKGAVATE